MVFILVAKALFFLKKAIKKQYTNSLTLDQFTLTEGAQAFIAHYVAYDKPLKIAFV